MDKEPLIKLNWQGAETVDEARAALDDADQIEITLPPNYNHALFRALHPEAPPSALEQLNTEAGPELLNKVAQIDGLEDLSPLAEQLRGTRASVRLSSPPTLLIDTGATRHA